MAQNTVGSASFKLSADTTDLDKGLKKAENRFSDFTGKFKALFLANIAGDFVGKLFKGFFDPFEEIVKNIAKKGADAFASLFDTVGRASAERKKQLQEELDLVNKQFAAYQGIRGEIQKFNIETSRLELTDRQRKIREFQDRIKVLPGDVQLREEARFIKALDDREAAENRITAKKKEQERLEKEAEEARKRRFEGMKDAAKVIDEANKRMQKFNEEAQRASQFKFIGDAAFGSKGAAETLGRAFFGGGGETVQTDTPAAIKREIERGNKLLEDIRNEAVKASQARAAAIGPAATVLEVTEFNP